jgi:hypothetical protein
LIKILRSGIYQTYKKTSRKILEVYNFDLWLAGFQPVRNTRAVLSMVSAYDDARVSKRA